MALSASAVAGDGLHRGRRWPLGSGHRHEAARTAWLLARLADARGDHQAASVQRERARAVFRELGATGDLANLSATEGEKR
jgi:hypothetical protein